jgi:hypothetical protein
VERGGNQEVTPVQFPVSTTPFCRSNWVSPPFDLPPVKFFTFYENRNIYFFTSFLAICSAPFSFSPKAPFFSLTFAKSTAESAPFMAWKLIILNNEYSRNYHWFGGLFRFGTSKVVIFNSCSLNSFPFSISPCCSRCWPSRFGWLIFEIIVILNS